MIHTFNKNNFREYCNRLAEKDTHLQAIIGQYVHPPMWQRPASFASLIHIILEQQVSLVSARAEAWRPYRSLATMLLWHHYIRTKGIEI